MRSFYEESLNRAETMIMDLSIKNSKLEEALLYVRCRLAGEIGNEDLTDVIDEALQKYCSYGF